VNRTPVSAKVIVARDNREINMFGCGISHTIAEARPSPRRRRAVKATRRGHCAGLRIKAAGDVAELRALS
jgi:hypothetical protein